VWHVWNDDVMHVTVERRTV